MESFPSATVSADNRQNSVGKLPFHSAAIGEDRLKLQKVDRENLPPGAIKSNKFNQGLS